MEIVDTIRVLILKRMRDEVLTGPEEKQLTEWLSESSENQQLYNSFMNPASFKQLFKDYASIIASAEAPSSIENIIAEPNPVVHKLAVSRRKRNWLAAASVLLIVSTSGILYFINRTTDKQATPAVAATPQKPIDVPGGNKALLTLADGSHIVLDDARNGTIAEQAGTAIRKQQDGQLLYDPSATTSTSTTINTLSTPRGGQYEIRLPDGTKAWLNAASSISFPVAFTGKERMVTVSGELYFEVAKNAQQPFIVKIAGPTNQDAFIKVLGTHFNVSAYPEESHITTTLLEGAVQVNKGTVINQLRPGQAASIDIKGSMYIDRQANTEQAIAWKNGSFVFNNQDIGTIMRQIGRWYDLDVTIEGNSTDKYYGEISKFKRLPEVLNLLKQYGIAFELDNANRKIIVKP